MTYAQWAARHPQAAAELEQVIGTNVAPPDDITGSEGMSEAWAQQRARFNAAHAGAMAWRNNVGATPAKCPACKAPQRPVRYGLSNDSAKLNAKVKSHDLILAIPRIITPEMVGSKIAQFGSVETKRPGWRYTGTEREAAQAAWGALIVRLGGFATFSTGELNL